MPLPTFNTEPLWKKEESSPSFPSLSSDIHVDVCVIGAGITGLTAAHILKRQGKKVAVVEMHQIGEGETGHTTAHMTEVLDCRFQNLIQKFGESGARMATEASRQSIDFIEKTCSQFHIECQFQRVPAFLFTEKSKDLDFLENESIAAQRLGVNHVLSNDRLPFFSALKSLRFDHQAQFHPFRYLKGLATLVQGDGSFIFENTRMQEIIEGEPCSVLTDRGMITADDVIVAAHVPSLNRFFLHTKMAAYRTYAIAFTLKEGVYPEALYWDTEHPYHYIRSAKIGDKKIVIVGGEDHKTGKDDHSENHFKKLESYASGRFEVDETVARWSGQIIEPVDGLPMIGLNSMSTHVYVSTGYSGNGMTFGTVGGMLLSDLILKRPHPWTSLFSATRIKPLAGMRSFLSENVDFPKCLVEDRLSLAVENDVQNIVEGEGTLVMMAGEKVAAYRDEHGLLHLQSPVCPHLGCHVHWNNAEKSWDCPCHGSRFSPVGELLNGPALTDLKKYSPEPVKKESLTYLFTNEESRPV